jgi:hypothetical protein
MNEIALQIIEIGKLIGKKVFVKHYHECTFYNDNEVPETFTVDDFDFYSYDILCGEIELMDIKYTAKFGRYYLVTFKDLQ